MDDSNIPTFVVDDNHKSLRVTVRDADGNPQDITDWTISLYATGIASGNMPGGADGLEGAIESAEGGVVVFNGLGAHCDPGTGRQADMYWYRIKSITDSSAVSWSDPLGHFIVANNPNPIVHAWTVTEQTLWTGTTTSADSFSWGWENNDGVESTDSFQPDSVFRYHIVGQSDFLSPKTIGLQRSLDGDTWTFVPAAYINCGIGSSGFSLDVNNIAANLVIGYHLRWMIGPFDDGEQCEVDVHTLTGTTEIV